MSLLGSSTHQVGSSVRNWISATHQWQGRWEDAARIAAESMRVAEQCKSRQLLAMSRALWGHAHWMIGGHAEGLQAVLEATLWIEERKGALVTSLNYGYLVNGAVATGRGDDARRHAARLWLRARHEDRLGEAMGCRALALAAARGSDFRRAEHYLAQADRSARLRESRHEEAANQLCRAEVEALRGWSAEARRWLDQAEAGFEAMAMRWHIKQAQRLRARL